MTIPLLDRLRSGRVGRLVKFGMVSAVSIVVSQVSIAVLFGLFRLSAQWSNIGAACIALVPSFQLSRRWVWQKKGSSHLTREVVPFWAMALIGLALSTVAAGLAEDWAKANLTSHFARTIVVMVGVLGSYGVLWLARFFILDHLVFHDREDLII